MACWRGILFSCSITLLALLFSACGGSSTTLDPGPGDNPLPTGQWTGTAADSATTGLTIAGVPEIPFDSLAHLPSELPATFELLGSEYLQKYNAEISGTDLILNAPADAPAGDYPIAYGLYKFAGLAEYDPQWLNIECLPQTINDNYYIGLADYTEGDWRWFGPVSFPEFQLDLRDLQQRIITELGNMYFIVVTRDGDGATLSKSTLTVAPAGEDPGLLPGAPHHLIATDGVYAEKIVIEWEPGPGAAYYELWRQHGEDGEWGKLAEPEGTRYEDIAVIPGQLYFYKAFSVNDAGRSAHSNIDEGYAGELGQENPPPPPFDLVASDGDYAEKVLVTWEYSADYTRFDVWRRQDGEDSEWYKTSQTEAKSFADLEVVPGTVYIYKVIAVRGELMSEPSNTDEGYAGELGGGELPAPHEIWASDGAHPDHVVVEWGYEGEYTSFELWRRSAESGVFELLAGIDGEHFRYEDFAVEPGVVYKYKVRAINGEQEGPFSDYDTGYTEASGGDLPAPFELVASKGNYLEKIRVEWSHEGDYSYFELWRRQDGEGHEWGKIAEIESKEYNDTELPGDFTFIYKVRAILGEQESEWSNHDFGYLGDGPGELPAPFELQASKGEFADRIKVWWHYTGDYDHFDLMRQTVDLEGEWEMIAHPEGLEYFDTELPGDYTYHYKVRAVLGEQVSAFSNTDFGYLSDPVEYCVLEVILRNAEEQPLHGIDVVLYGGELPVVQETGENGITIFDELPRGRYLAVPMHRELAFEPVLRMVDFREGETSREILFAGAVDETQSHRLRGVVYTFHGDLGPNRFAPLAGALVTIELIGSEETWHAETNEAGYWTKPDLPAGTYLVTVAKEGYTFNPEIHDPVINGEDLPGRCDFRAYPQD